MLKTIPHVNEEVRREYLPNMIDRSGQSMAREVPRGPRSHNNLVWRKEVNAADGKEDIMTADPRRAGTKRPAISDSPNSESGARKIVRLDTTTDEVPNGAATPASEATSEDIFTTRSRASPLARPEHPHVLSHPGSVQASRHSSPASHHSVLSTINGTSIVDKNAFAMTIPIAELLEKSSDLGAAKGKLDIAQIDYNQMIELHESLTEQRAEFPAVKEQLEEEKSFIEEALQKAQETYDRSKTELAEQLGLAFNNAAKQREDSAKQASRLEAENSRLQKDLQMQNRTLESLQKDIEELKRFRQQFQSLQKPAMDRKQIVEVVEEKLAWERDARTHLETLLRGDLAKTLNEMDDWKKKLTKKSASADQKAEDLRTRIEANEQKVQQLETNVTEQSKKVEDAKSILTNLQTSVANLLGKDLEAGQRHKTCLKMISDLEANVNAVNDKLEAADRRQAEHANLAASTAVPDNHDASELATLVSKIDALTNSKEELVELQARVVQNEQWIEERDATLTTEIEQLSGKVEYCSSKINIMEYDVKHAAAPLACDELIANLRAQVDALKDAQQQQHVTSERLEASVSTLQSSQRNASDTCNEAAVQELTAKHDAQTNITQTLQRQLDVSNQRHDAFNQRLDVLSAHTQRLRETLARPATNSPRGGADVLPIARTATPPQIPQSPTIAQPNEVHKLRTEYQQLRTDFEGLRGRLNEIIISMNNNNKESDIQKALDKADSAERSLTSRAQELIDIMARLGALEDTKMKVEAALKALVETQHGIRVSREATQRLELLSNGHQAKLRETEEKVEGMISRLDNGESRQENINTRLNTLEDLDIANSLHVIEDRVTAATAASDRAGISFGIIQEAITNIESAVGQSETDFKALEKEQWQLSAEQSSSAT
ncbi:hypothetical protein MBLNU457_1848t1 [Dothideomycetes sp. NU457]